MKRFSPFGFDFDWINDDFAVFRQVTINKPTKFYNPEEYDLVPKPETTKRLIKQKESELEELKKTRDKYIELYESMEKTITNELDQLHQKQLNP